MPRHKGFAGKDTIEFTEEKLIQAIPGTYGILENIAKNAGCGVKTIARAKKKFKKFGEEVDLEEDIGIKDLAKKGLVANAMKADITTCIYLAKAKMGWHDRPVNGPMEGTFTIRWEGEETKKKKGKDGDSNPF